MNTRPTPIIHTFLMAIQALDHRATPTLCQPLLAGCVFRSHQSASDCKHRTPVESGAALGKSFRPNKPEPFDSSLAKSPKRWRKPSGPLARTKQFVDETRSIARR